jgi:hypothetical protein
MHIVKNNILIDLIFQQWRGILGNDFEAYRNHVYRVYNIGLELLGETRYDDLNDEKLAIAAAFHDIGLWANKTWDYLEPSKVMAQRHLEKMNRSEWTDEVLSMIEYHHKMGTYRGNHATLTETLRRADMIDLSGGLISFGVSALFKDQLYKALPVLSFRKTLFVFFCKNILRNPFKPLPMIRY